MKQDVSIPHHLKVVAPVATALLWLGVGVTALGMAFGAFWPDDLRGGGGAARAREAFRLRRGEREAAAPPRV